MKIRLRRSLPFSVVLALVLACAAEPAGDVSQTADHLVGSILTGPSMNTLHELADGFGPRVSGSPSYEHAAEWAADRFRSYGIQNVRLEAFTLPNGWQRGWAKGEMTSPMERPLHLASLGWSPSTPQGGVQGDVVVIGDLSPDSITAQAAQIKDHIVLFDAAKTFSEGYRKVLPLLRPAYGLLRDEGALAVLFPDREKDNVLNAHGAGYHATLAPLPVVQTGMEDAQMMLRLLREPKGRVTVKLEIQNATSGTTQVHNVVAEIRGREHPDEWILIGAHLDSWDFGTGAQDNGSGSAMVLEAARAIASLPQPARRSIRFALWGGEEEGILGSLAYTQAHRGGIGQVRRSPEHRQWRRASPRLEGRRPQGPEGRHGANQRVSTQGLERGRFVDGCDL
jgi:carboxypeptidase Q